MEIICVYVATQEKFSFWFTQILQTFKWFSRHHTTYAYKTKV